MMRWRHAGEGCHDDRPAHLFGSRSIVGCAQSRHMRTMTALQPVAPLAGARTPARTSRPVWHGRPRTRFGRLDASTTCGRTARQGGGWDLIRVGEPASRNADGAARTRLTCLWLMSLGEGRRSKKTVRTERYDQCSRALYTRRLRLGSRPRSSELHHSPQLGMSTRGVSPPPNAHSAFCQSSLGGCHLDQVRRDRGHDLTRAATEHLFVMATNCSRLSRLHHCSGRAWPLQPSHLAVAVHRKLLAHQLSAIKGRLTDGQCERTSRQGDGRKIAGPLPTPGDGLFLAGGRD
jgi:hypothetical protein